MKDSNAVPSVANSSAANSPVSAPAISSVEAAPDAATAPVAVSGASTKTVPTPPAGAKPADSNIELPAAFLPKNNAPTADKSGAVKTANAQSVTNKSLPVRTAVATATTNSPAAQNTTAPVIAPARRAPRLRPLYIVGIVAIVVFTGVAGAGASVYNNWKNEGIIAPKVTIAGENVGGLTREKAVARLNHRFGKLAFTLQTGDKNVVLGLAAVGGKPSVEPTVSKALAIGRDENMVGNFMRVFGSEVKPRSFMLPIEWNRGALTSRLKIVNQQYAKPAFDARLITVSGAAPLVQGEVTGRALDVAATADAIQKSYYLGVAQVKAVTTPTTPSVRAADLAGRDVKLGEYRTEYNGGIAGRTTNIHVACHAVDGQVFMPGEVLSFNGLTGERTFAKGYRMGHIFLREKGQTEAQIVEGLAGGVCQVSSTLYNAVRKVNSQSAGKPLQIVERNTHSLPVTYVPSGRDATVAWPGKDFKFRNRYDFPIYVRTAAGNGRLTISIWGRVPDNRVTPVSLRN